MEVLVVNYKLSFKLFLCLSVAIECLNAQDCQLPIKPIYGGYQVAGNKLIYSCMNGYGLIGLPARFCKKGKWDGSFPFCVKAVILDNNSLTDGNPSTCVFTSRLINLLGVSVSSAFIFDGTFSSATIRVSMTPYSLLETRLIFLNKESCEQTKEYHLKESNLYSYEYNCLLFNTGQSRIEIVISRTKAFAVCEIQVLPNRDISCPLSELPAMNVSIIYDPKVSGETATYGTAAIYKCNENATLRGSGVRYCIDGNQWSGNQTFCEEVRYKQSLAVKYFEAIVSSSVVAGFIAVVIAISVCITLRKKRVKNSSQDIQRCESGPSRISTIDHYYNTTNYDYTENNDRTYAVAVSCENEDDYCTVNETATTGAPTNWKFAQFTIRKPTSPASLLENEIYLGD